ncbi:MAG: hypothetical protein AB3N14_15770 [Flavobacteriaceae bacterium]
MKDTIKTLSMVLLALTILGLSACRNQSEEDDRNYDEEFYDSKTEKISGS